MKKRAKKSLKRFKPLCFWMPPFPRAIFHSRIVMSHFPVCRSGPVQLTLTVTAVLGPVHSTQYRPVSGHSWARSHSGYSPVARLAIVSAGQCQAVRLSSRLPLTLSGL